MGYFPVRYDLRVVIYDRRGFIRLATDLSPPNLSIPSERSSGRMDEDSDRRWQEEPFQPVKKCQLC